MSPCLVFPLHLHLKMSPPFSMLLVTAACVYLALDEDKWELSLPAAAGADGGFRSSDLLCSLGIPSVPDQLNCPFKSDILCSLTHWRFFDPCFRCTPGTISWQSVTGLVLSWEQNVVSWFGAWESFGVSVICGLGVVMMGLREGRQRLPTMGTCCGLLREPLLSLAIRWVRGAVLDVLRGCGHRAGAGARCGGASPKPYCLLLLLQQSPAGPSSRQVSPPPACSSGLRGALSFPQVFT